MIRNIKANDKLSVALYLSKKLSLSINEASIKIKKIIKSGLPSFLKEDKDLQGVCYIENRIVNDKKEKFIEIFCDNWRLAESYIQILRWNVNGIYWFSLPKHDFLNRTFNKNGLRYVRCEGDRNIYCYKFEKRNFYNSKKDDNQ